MKKFRAKGLVYSLLVVMEVNVERVRWIYVCINNHALITSTAGEPKFLLHLFDFPSVFSALHFILLLAKTDSLRLGFTGKTIAPFIAHACMHVHYTVLLHLMFASLQTNPGRNH